MANTTTDKLDGLVLSATEVQELTGWSAPMVEDYLNIFQNILSISQDVDIIDERENIFDKKTTQLIAVINGEVAKNRGLFIRHENDLKNLEQLVMVLNGLVYKNKKRSLEAEAENNNLEQLIYAW